VYLPGQPETNSDFGADKNDCTPLQCIGELLTLVLSGGEDRPCIEFADCCFDPATRIEARSLFSIKVDCERRDLMDGNMAITMAGSVDNHQDESKEFTLYLYMWRQGCDHGDPGWMSGGNGLYSWSRMLDIPGAGRRPQQLSDGLFDVLLYRNTSSSARVIVGGGRGFFLFRTTGHVCTTGCKAQLRIEHI